MAATGKLAGVTIVNNIPLANTLAAAGVPYVISRTVAGSGDAQPRLSGTPADIQIGIDYWNSGICQRDRTACDPRVYIVPFGTNEQNYPGDAYFFLGLMQAASKQGRRLAVFSNGVGNPQDLTQDANGKVHSATWQLRVDSGCMRFGNVHGHLANLHQYGRLVGDSPTEDPGSEIFRDGHRDDAAYFWFSGRHAAIWRDIIPDDSKMRIFVGECGSSDANLHGQDFIADFANYQVRYGDDPDIAAFAYWSTGDSGGFAYSTLDGDLPAILGMLQ